MFEVVVLMKVYLVWIVNSILRQMNQGLAQKGYFLSQYQQLNYPYLVLFINYLYWLNQ